jgi:aryl carrier-like protein
VTATDTPHAAPATEMERIIAETWEDVLGFGGIGLDDSLFSIGADSLQIFRIATRLADRGLPIQAKHLLQHPTIRKIAAFADTAKGTTKTGSSIATLRDFRNGARRRGTTGLAS